MKKLSKNADLGPHWFSKALGELGARREDVTLYVSIADKDEAQKYAFEGQYEVDENLPLHAWCLKMKNPGFFRINTGIFSPGA